MECLFCKIARKEIDARIIYESDDAVAFLDIFPHAPGHSVIISKSHVESIIDLPEKGVGPFFSAVKHVVALLKNKLNPDGFTIGVNQGKCAGQFVNHLHVHVMPRFEGDGGGSLHSVVANPPKEGLDDIYKKIVSIRN